ncbi:ash family protein [Rahnella sp. PD12R]|nr:ash family protein [Rahnella sp. PD12R]
MYLSNTLLVFAHSMVAQAGQPSGWPGFWFVPVLRTLSELPPLRVSQLWRWLN